MAKILLIEDDDMVRATIKAMMVSGGHSVAEALDGERATEIYEKEKFDLVVTDILMPRREGIETILKVRAFDPFAKIIAISGGGRTKNMVFLEMAEAIGANAVLRKPFTKAKLLRTIDQVLA